DGAARAGRPRGRGRCRGGAPERPRGLRPRLRRTPDLPIRGGRTCAPVMAQPEHISKIPPERRLALRVPVRRAVRAALRLRGFAPRRTALSGGGCRRRCPEPVTAHGSLWIVLPAGFGGRLPLPIRGEVARAESVRGAPTGVCDVALRFHGLSPRASERLWAAV